MAEYNPPLEDLPIFDNLVFLDDQTPVTIAYANTHYLRFPNAQGTENLQAINVFGPADFNNTVNVDGLMTTTNAIDMLGTSAALNNISTRQLKLKDFTTGATNGTTIYTNTNNLILASEPVAGSNSGISFLTRNSLNTVINSLTLSPVSVSSPLPLQLTGIAGSSYIQTRAYSFYDINTGAVANSNIYYQSTGMNIDCTTPNSTFTLVTQNGASVNTSALIATSTNLRTLTPTIPLTTDNSDKIPTTAWVQNALSAFVPTLPTTVVNRAYISRYNFTGGNIPLTVTMSSGGVGSGPLNEYLTFRLTYTMACNNSGTAPAISRTAWTTSCVFNIYPYRFTSNWNNNTSGTFGSPPSQLAQNFTQGFAGSDAFDYVNATAAPSGRQWWAYDVSYIQSGITGFGADSMLKISGTASTNSFIIYIVNPTGYNQVGSANSCNLTLEYIANNQVPLTVTTSGFNVNF